jgi:hypothetical protein
MLMFKHSMFQLDILYLLQVYKGRKKYCACLIGYLIFIKDTVQKLTCGLQELSCISLCADSRHFLGKIIIITLLNMHIFCEERHCIFRYHKVVELFKIKL